MMMKRVVLLLVLALTLSHCARSRNSLLPMMYEYELQEARQLIKNNKNHQAIDELNMLIQMDPQNVRALELRAVAYQKLNRFERAVADYNRVVEISSSAPKAHYNLGMIHAYKLGNRAQALLHFNTFLTLAPQHKEAFNVAKIMRSLDRRGASTAGPRMQAILASAQEAGSKQEKRERLQEGVKEMPQSPVFYYLLAQSYEAEGVQDKKRYKDALKYYRLSLKHRPTCARCNQGLGDLLVKLDRSHEAQDYLRKAKLFNPQGRKAVE